jgi:pimeloyl-ACP methyl ester carboxylesterase
MLQDRGFPGFWLYRKARRRNMLRYFEEQRSETAESHRKPTGCIMIVALAMPEPHRFRSPHRGRARTAFLLLLLLVVVLWRPASAHVRAALLLERMADPAAHGFLAEAAGHAVDVRDATVAGTRTRLYRPVDVVDPPGLVLVHGVHWKGIDEPRLQAFARSLAASGVAVVTPEIRELCDYRIDPASIGTIGETARAFSEQLGGEKVGVLGFSFAGGLALIAASDPRYRRAFGFVVAVGAHDDLARVLRFFVTDQAPRPDGSVLRLHAHDYGIVVLEYAHAEDFFPPTDVVAARDTLRSILHEDFEAAREQAKALSPAGAVTMGHILAHETAALAPELSAEIERLQPGFAAVSPDAHIGQLRVPVLLLHGASDRLIPSSEAEWLARQVPRGMLREVLVSGAIEHVGLGEGPTGLSEKLALVHFLGELLEETENQRP